MDCPKCGKELDENVAVCPECGEIIIQNHNDEEQPTDNKIEDKAEKDKDVFDAEKMKEIQSEAYLEALRKLEAEKTEKEKAVKDEKNAKVKGTLKKVLPLVAVVLALVIVISGVVFAVKKIKYQIHQYDAIESAIDKNSNYDKEYNTWKDDNNASESKCRKALLKMGEYSLDKDRFEATLYFFGELKKYSDEEYNQKAVSAFDKKFNALAEKNKYKIIIDCIDCYNSLGGKFDNTIVTDGVEKLINEKDPQDAIALLNELDSAKIKYDKSKVQQWALSFAKNGDKTCYYDLIKYIKDNELDCDTETEDYLVTFGDEYCSAEDYENAYKFYELYTGKKDFSENMKKCKFAFGVQSFKDENYSEACNYLKCFEGDNDYKDAYKLYIKSWILVHDVGFQNTYSNSYDSDLNRAETKLKRILKNPYSYIRQSYSKKTYVYVEDNDGSAILEENVSIHLSYTATNSFGAAVADTYWYYDTKTTYNVVGLTYEQVKSIDDMTADELLESLNLS